MEEVMNNELRYNLPFKDYLEDPGIGSGTIKVLVSETPAHAKYLKENPTESDSLSFGRAAHEIQLGGLDAFREKFKVVPKMHKGYLVKPDQIKELLNEELITDEEAESWLNSKVKGADVYAYLSDKFGEDRLLEQFDHSKLLELHAALRKKTKLSALLDYITHTEVSFFWEDKDTGVRCKGRADAFADVPGLGTIVIDYKTTAHSLGRFETTIANFGYHLQEAHYRRGLKACGLDIAGFLFIAQETSPPFECVYGTLISAASEYADGLCETSYRQWKFCTDNNNFSGYPDVTLDFDLPSWAYNK